MMAEFQEVVFEFHRLCDQRRLHKNPCDKCPIKIATLGTLFQCYRYVLEKPKEAENIIMAWAAEHPEPVYPSVAEYLERLGITIRHDGTVEADFFKANEPMNADVAKLLGIEPKESV